MDSSYIESYSPPSSIPKERVRFFNQLPLIKKVSDLLIIGERRSRELGYTQTGRVFRVSSKSSHILLLNNLERALAYAKRNKADVYKFDKYFKASGDNSMLDFDKREYFGQIAGTRMIASVNFKPFHSQAGILIPKPDYSNGLFNELISSWSLLTLEDLEGLKVMSTQGIAIWNAMSSPSSPYMHFQYIPDVISTENGSSDLPLSAAIEIGDFDKFGVQIGHQTIPMFISNSSEETLDTLIELENLDTPADLLITKGFFIIAAKRSDTFIVKYPWDVYWKPTAERLGFIFFHPNMKNYLEYPDEFVTQFWEVNNSQLIDLKTLKFEQ